MDEIKACIIQTFGELRTKLTESDLEQIMNTKMITTNRAEELVKQQGKEESESESDDNDDYIKVTSLFSRVSPTTPQGEAMVDVKPEVSEEDIVNRSIALKNADHLSSQKSV